MIYFRDVFASAAAAMLLGGVPYLLTGWGLFRAVAVVAFLAWFLGAVAWRAGGPPPPKVGDRGGHDLIFGPPRGDEAGPRWWWLQ